MDAPGMMIQETAPGLWISARVGPTRRGDRPAGIGRILASARTSVSSFFEYHRRPHRSLAAHRDPDRHAVASAPVQRWWIYLLAAFPAHLVGRPRGLSWPISLVLALYGTMCSEALVAAVCVRLFSDAPCALRHAAPGGCFHRGRRSGRALRVLVSGCGGSIGAAARTVLARLADPIFLERPDGAHAGAGHRDGHHPAIGQGREHRPFAATSKQRSWPWRP